MFKYSVSVWSQYALCLQEGWHFIFDYTYVELCQFVTDFYTFKPGMNALLSSSKSFSFILAVDCTAFLETCLLRSVPPSPMMSPFVIYAKLQRRCQFATFPDDVFLAASNSYSSLLLTQRGCITSLLAALASVVFDYLPVRCFTTLEQLKVTAARIQ